MRRDRCSQLKWFDQRATAPEPTAARLVILTIGEVEQWQAARGTLPAESRISYADLNQLDAALLNEVKPSMVLSPLVCLSFDCLDVAAALAASGFTGRYRAICAPLPDASIIRREIRLIAPTLDFDVINFAPGTSLNRLI